MQWKISSNVTSVNFKQHNPALAAKTIPSKRRYVNKYNYGKVPRYLKEI